MKVITEGHRYELDNFEANPHLGDVTHNTIVAHRQEVPPAEPTTKECPYCLSVVPLKATRCAHCTSDLKA